MGCHSEGVVLCVVLMETVPMHCSEFGQSFTFSHCVLLLFLLMSLFLPVSSWGDTQLGGL